MEASVTDLAGAGAGSRETFRHLRPRDIAGWSYTALVSAITGGAIYLSLQPNWGLWFIGQSLFALAFLQWFVLIHEAGHGILFRSPLPNWIVGYVAGFFALIPFQAWRYIHAGHHRWTGWQDKDATTASLVPRELAAWERWVLRIAWRTYFPLSSISYRVLNYWALPRIRQYVTPSQYLKIRQNVLFSALTYAALLSFAGPAAVLSSCWLGLLLSFAAQDIILLSQHTHIPQHLSHGKDVAPFPHLSQGEFTRSLRFPSWFSKLILHFDAHELHHQYVHVPGYDLSRVPKPAENEVDWWTWLREVKKLPGDVFLFENRDRTGFPW